MLQCSLSVVAVFFCIGIILMSAHIGLFISLGMLLPIMLFMGQRAESYHGKIIAIENIHIAVIAANENIKIEEAKERVLFYHK